MDGLKATFVLGPWPIFRGFGPLVSGRYSNLGRNHVMPVLIPDAWIGGSTEQAAAGGGGRRHSPCWSRSCQRTGQCRPGTPPKFNMAPEQWWLEDYFPIGKATFQCYIKLREGKPMGGRCGISNSWWEQEKIKQKSAPGVSQNPQPL